MSAFEFYLSFYGLLLGLSVAEVASGLLNAVGARHRARLGKLTLLLAVFVFLDITSFWIYFWGIREHVTVNSLTMSGGLVVALTYYLSAGLVFPRNISEWPDLDEHYRLNKRLVTGGLLVANVITTAASIRLHPPSPDWGYWFLMLTYWPMLIALPFSRSDRLDYVLYAFLIGGYVANALLPTSWVLQ